MKVLLINGSPHGDGCTYTALSEVSSQLQKQGITTEIFQLGTQAVRDCIACGGCNDRGFCAFGDKDGVNSCIEKINGSDGLVLGSPVYYAGPSGSFTAFLDRVFYAKESFACRLGAAVVSCRRGGASATFDRLNKYFTISSMPVVSSQYWNSVHGNTPEEVRKDLEGMQTMRTLANNMAWLLKSIETARGIVPLPKAEPRIGTNFIRKDLDGN